MKPKLPWSEETQKKIVEALDVVFYFLDLAPVVVLLAVLAASGLKGLHVAAMAVLFFHTYLSGRRHLRWEHKEERKKHDALMLSAYADFEAHRRELAAYEAGIDEARKELTEMQNAVDAAIAAMPDGSETKGTSPHAE